MKHLHLVVAWLAILLGLVSGSAIGIFFSDDGWLGGYGSWSRRMLRLGHVSLVGTGLLNLAFALSIWQVTAVDAGLWLPSRLFILGAVSMPSVCFLSAWRKPLRHLFFVPVLALIAATLLFIVKGLWP